MNYTQNLELSQFEASDKPKWLVNYNGDMKKIDDEAGRQADTNVRVQASFTQMALKIEDNKTKLEDHETRIGTLESGIGGQDVKISQIQANVDQVHHETVTNANRITVLENGAIDKGVEIDELKREVVQVQDDVAELDAQMETSNEDINRLGGRIDSADNNIADLTTRVSTAETNIAKKIDHVVESADCFLWLSNNGNDANDGKSSAKAIKTLRRAVEIAGKFKYNHVELNFVGTYIANATTLPFENATIPFNTELLSFIGNLQAELSFSFTCGGTIWLRSGLNINIAATKVLNFGASNKITAECAVTGNGAINCQDSTLIVGHFKSFASTAELRINNAIGIINPDIRAVTVTADAILTGVKSQYRTGGGVNWYLGEAQ